MTEQFTFEKAYDRLEEILQNLSSSEVSLDTSLSLYEEATTLIKQCNKKLTAAEQKIEKLLKEDDGSILLDSNGEPKKETFEHGSETLISREVD